MVGVMWAPPCFVSDVIVVALTKKNYDCDVKRKGFLETTLRKKSRNNLAKGVIVEKAIRMGILFYTGFECGIGI